MHLISRKIPVTVLPSFWILALLIGWMNGMGVNQVLTWMAVVFISVLVHELGHALFALLWKQEVRIELGAFGGATIRIGGIPLTRGKEFVVILMGPLFSLALAFLSAYALSFSWWPSFMLYFWEVAWVANIIWTVLNLLPIHPLDGGKLLSVTFDTLFGKAGIRFSYLVSGIIATLAAAIFLFANSLITVFIFILCAFESFRAWSIKARDTTVGTEIEIPNEIKAADEQWTNNAKEEAVEQLEAFCKKEQPLETRLQGLERLSYYLLAANRSQRVLEILLPYKSKLSGALLRDFQLASFQNGQWNLSLQSGQQAYLENPDGSCALLNAFSSARLGNVQSAINWLLSAKLLGNVDLRTVVFSEEFDPIRQDPEFSDFMKRYCPI